MIFSRWSGMERYYCELRWRKKDISSSVGAHDRRMTRVKQARGKNQVRASEWRILFSLFFFVGGCIFKFFGSRRLKIFSCWLWEFTYNHSANWSCGSRWKPLQKYLFPSIKTFQYPQQQIRRWPVYKVLSHPISPCFLTQFEDNVLVIFVDRHFCRRRRVHAASPPFPKSTKRPVPWKLHSICPIPPKWVIAISWPRL